MIKKVKKYCFGNPDKKIGDVVCDQLGQEFKVVKITDNEIHLERVDN
jgi:hypothetical protein